MIIPFRLAPDTLPATIVGAALLCFAVVMAIRQWWAHRELISNSKLDEAAFLHTEQQIHRRLGISGLLFLLGVLIPLGDQMGVFFLQRPGLFFGYWIGVLLLVLLMVLVALIDLMSTVAYARHGRVRLGLERQAIEEDIRRYRASQKNSSNQDRGQSE